MEDRMLDRRNSCERAPRGLCWIRGSLGPVLILSKLVEAFKRSDLQALPLCDEGVAGAGGLGGRGHRVDLFHPPAPLP